MNIKCYLYCLFSLVFSLNFLSAESYTVWDTIPMQDGSFIVIVDDSAKTVLKVFEGESSSYQIGDVLEIDDLYKISNNAIEIENKNSGKLTQMQRLGGLWKKRDGTASFQITEIKDFGPSLIVFSSSEKTIDDWNAKVYVDQVAFKRDFQVGDCVYIVDSISYDWPNHMEMLTFGGSDEIWWSNRMTCFVKREEGVSSQWFYSWDPYD